MSLVRTAPCAAMVPCPCQVPRAQQHVAACQGEVSSPQPSVFCPHCVAYQRGLTMKHACMPGLGTAREVLYIQAVMHACVMCDNVHWICPGHLPVKWCMFLSTVHSTYCRLCGLQGQLQQSASATWWYTWSSVTTTCIAAVPATSTPYVVVYNCTVCATVCVAGGEACTICPVDTYGPGGVDDEGRPQSCINCTENQQTLYPGAKSAEQCVCKPG
jgi:hypothetical protein